MESARDPCSTRGFLPRLCLGTRGECDREAGAVLFGAGGFDGAMVLFDNLFCYC